MQLTAEDISNLKAVLPSNVRPFVDFLLSKFLDKDLRRALGVGDQRAKTVVKHFDEVASRLHIVRNVAVLKVGNKVVKTTKQGVKNTKQAVEREMRRVAMKEKLICEVAHQV